MPFCPVADLAAQWVLLDDRIAADWLPADDPALCLAADERRLAIETSVMHLPIASDAGAAFVAWLLALHVSLADDDEEPAELRDRHRQAALAGARNLTRYLATRAMM
ncbi:MAG: hypothetical protein CMO30_22680 [Tistrella sp.]|jgi:hypothetical protein|uniref:Uncharacterized protein n=1 Tax=Tistrella mobilis TaxID=171437 RepID=A0A3B9INC6_9PROT|nr:hypothetical protein [Tistrella sp.]MAD37432.1 hypothetical protein [Tistrella sp.]MBA78088.1 hypothetical protein [Tistrella sp.]HAE49208.1 hypothetical protein [Tistrella mobilis]